MKKLISTLTLMLALGQVACSTDPITAVCERADECGNLRATVDRCVDDINDWYDERLSATGQMECPGELENCASKATCASFESCMLDGRAYACHPF